LKDTGSIVGAICPFAVIYSVITVVRKCLPEGAAE